MGVFAKAERFQYFNNVMEYPDWKSSDILDIGGNAGNFIQSAGKEIIHKRYTSLDVDKEALRVGQLKFPAANWILHNEYTPSYNPKGEVRPVYPFPDESFDAIMAYSIHTHCTIENWLHSTSEAYRMLRPGGKICFTYLTYHNIPFFLTNRNIYYDKVIDASELEAALKEHGYTYLIDADDQRQEVSDDFESHQFLAFYTPEMVQKLFSDYDHKLVSMDGFLQHGILIQKKT